MSLDQGLRALSVLLDRLRIPWFAGGSLASSIHGAYRATADVDLVIALDEATLPSFATACREQFYIDEETAREAIRLARPFNVIHLASGFKFDIFPVMNSPFHQSQMRRRQSLPCPLPGMEHFLLPVCTVEDTILAKLLWWRMGGGVSDRQWADLIAMRDAHSGRLDLVYLRRWAAQLDIESDLGALLS